MSGRTLFVVVLLLGFSISSQDHGGVTFITQAQADELPAVWKRKVSSLIKNIDNARRSLAAAQAADLQDSFKAKQWRDRIGSYRRSLDKVPASDDPLLGQANDLLASLVSEFAARQSGTAVQPNTGATTADTGTGTGNISSAGTSSVAGTAPSSDIRPLVSGERVRVKRHTRQIRSMIDSISGEGPSPFQDPEIVAQRKKSLDQYTEAVKRYPQVSDPDVIALRTAYRELGEKLRAEYQRSREQLEIVGNVMERLDTISNRNQEFPVPAALQPPFGTDQVQAWLEAGSKARTAAEFDMKQLQEIAPHAYLPEQTVSGRMAKYSFRDLDRLANNVRGRFDAVQESYVATNENITRRLAELDNSVQSPSAGHDKATVQRHRDSLDEMIAVAESAVHLESVLKRPTDKVQGKVDNVRQRRQHYDQALEAAIDAVRMPPAKSSDSEMLDIAMQVLSNPDYEFGEHGRIVLNTSGMTDREKKSSEIDIDKVDVSGGDITVSGTETTWTYRWKEFQFATALREPESELWRVHYIMAKYYTSGGNRTPLNRWISGGVVATDLIREEHVR